MAGAGLILLKEWGTCPVPEAAHRRLTVGGWGCVVVQQSAGFCYPAAGASPGQLVRAVGELASACQRQGCAQFQRVKEEGLIIARFQEGSEQWVMLPNGSPPLYADTVQASSLND